MITQQRSTPVRRRNGKQQACEPCRKRKLACDHDYPTCHRCQRRKISQDCVYLPPSKQSSVLAGSQRRSESTTSPLSPPPHLRNLDTISTSEITPTPGNSVTPGA